MNPAIVAKVTEGREKEEKGLNLSNRTAAKPLEDPAIDEADPAEPTSGRRGSLRKQSTEKTTIKPGLAFIQLRSVLARTLRDFGGDILQPLFVFIGTTGKSTLTLVIGEIQMVGIGFADLVFALALVVVPTNKVDGVIEVVSISAAAAR